MHRLAGLIPAFVIIGACKPHATVRAPDARDAFERRMAAYSKLAPARIVETTTVTVNVKSGVASSVTNEFLVLRNGVQIHHADDLLPVVGEDSATAYSASQSAQYRAKRWKAEIGGWTAVLLGMVLGGYATRPDLKNPGQPLPAYFYGAVGMMVVGG